MDADYLEELHLPFHTCTRMIEELTSHMDSIGRFRTPYLYDDVAQVGREPLRKRSATDRLVSPLNTALKYSLPVDLLADGPDEAEAL